MNKLFITNLLVQFALWINGSAEGQSLPAFPGAEGPGADATGGRVGDVYHVTNLLDYHPSGVDTPIPGSLRYGLENAPSAGRTIVFDVGGIIKLVPDVHQSTHTWLRSGKSNITIAGQTAPGPGITIAGQGGKLSGNNWILRHIKFRPGQDQSRPGILTNDAISNNLQNSIIDHVSTSWADDEAISSTDAASNTTVQYSILGEGQNYPLDDGTTHAFGAIISSEVDDSRLSYHHNLFIHNRSRNPRLGSENGTGAVLNFSNNVIYNWSGRAGYSFEKPSRTNFLSNYYIAGSDTASSDVVFYSPDSQTQIYHQFGNHVDMNKNGTVDGGLYAFNGPQFQGTAAIFTRTPFDVTSGHVQSAEAAVTQVLEYVGAQWWDRDPIDHRLTSDLANGTGSFIDYIIDAPQDPSYTYDLDGFPIYGITQRPANFDTDGDGMSDTWEELHGLNPNVAEHTGDFDGDGYTDLEEYLNDLGAFPAPTPITWIGGSGRYEEIQNWGINQTIPVGTFTNWQPSRLDQAKIKSGDVTLESVGQYASDLRVAPDSGDVASLHISDGWLEAHGTIEIGLGGVGQVALSGGKLRVGRLSKGPEGTLNFTGGVLAAAVVDFDLVNNGGIIAPSLSGGITEVSGDLTLNGGSVQITLGSSSSDQLIVSGSVSLGGMLDISLAPGVTIGPGQTFEILQVGNLLDGVFLGMQEGGFVGNYGADLFITYRGGDGNDVALFSNTGLPGDFNGDGIVDAVDYAVWRDNRGTSFNLNGNGDETGGSSNRVDAADYSLWRSAYGQSHHGVLNSNMNGTVPEPSTILCLLIAVAGVYPTRRLPRQNRSPVGPRLAAMAVFGSIVLQGQTSLAAPATTSATKTGWDLAPGILSRIVAPKFPSQVFDITDYGAVAKEGVKCTEAFRKAIAACSESGGGRVVTPPGKFLTGPIHFQSNVELHLAEGAEIVFSDQFDDYLPVVLVRVGGIELYNYSPLIYARNCTNIAITGPGKLNGNARLWWEWQKNETRMGFEMGEAGVPVEDRVFGTPEAAIRPSFISFVSCTNVLLEDFTIGSGPNWTIHPIYCRNTTIRGVNVVTDGPNNDGIDPDSCTDMLIENCTFDTGDDCVVLKSGYNQDGWRVGRPTENVIMRKCTSKRGHGGLVIGSEMSGDVRNVFLEDCDFEGTDRAIRIKSRADRGGIVENVYARNLKVRAMQREVIILNMGYTADRGELADVTYPVFRDMVFEDITGNGAPTAVLMRGLEQSPIRNILFRNITIASEKGVNAEYVRHVIFDQVHIAPESGPVFTLNQASDVKIKSSNCLKQSSVFLELKGASSRDIIIDSCDLSSATTPVIADNGAERSAVVER